MLSTLEKENSKHLIEGEEYIRHKWKSWKKTFGALNSAKAPP